MKNLKNNSMRYAFLIGLLTVTFMACQEEEIESLVILDEELETRATVIEKDDFSPKKAEHNSSKVDTYTITTNGTFTFGENLEGVIVVDAPGKSVTIDGKGRTLKAQYNGTKGNCNNDANTNQAGDVILVKRAKHIVIKNMTIRGVGNNSIRIANYIARTNWNNGKFRSPKVDNVTIVNPASSDNRPCKSGGGGIEIGQGKINNCNILSGDDAVKLSQPNAEVRNTDIEMQGNGTAIQFGWRKRATGSKHTAGGVFVKGWTKTVNNVQNHRIHPGYAVVGGWFQNNVSDINVNVTVANAGNFRHAIKLIADGANVNDIDIFLKSNNGFENKDNWKQIALTTKNGGKLSGIDITMTKGSNGDSFNFSKMVTKQGGNISGKVNNNNL